MTVRIHRDVVQGSDEWLQMRCGLITASEMKLLITPTLKVASNEKERAHVYELAAQRITRFVEPQYVSDDMLRGMDDECEARRLYSEKYGAVEQVGFITNDRWGFAIGYSPDGQRVGERAGIECKSRRQRFQIQTMVENVTAETIPTEYLIQHQTGLLVAEWKWIDFVSYSGGLPMAVVRVYPDDAVQDAIISAAGAAEERIARVIATYRETIEAKGFIPTERRVEQAMYV